MPLPSDPSRRPLPAEPLPLTAPAAAAEDRPSAGLAVDSPRAEPGRGSGGRFPSKSVGPRVCRRAAATLRWILAIVMALVFAYPLLWLLSASLKPRGEVFDNRLIPRTISLDNYVEVWNVLPLAEWFMNSVLIAVAGATLITLSSAMVAFGFARYRFPGKNVLFGLVLATMMLPGAVTLVPNYLIWQRLGFLGTTVPLWGASLFGSAFYIFLMRQFFRGIPSELFDAARVDGCGPLRLFTRIGLPLALPSAIIVWLFEFQASWNNFQGALIYLNVATPEQYTVPLGINYAMTMFSPTAGGQGDYQYVMVASVAVTLPMLVLFALGQRRFVEGLASAGVKG